ncbi:MAG: hypothetical protein C0392_15670 [Syntrophus sp. (in: bacteria)]|nr:hypothetical protein [Syntrophus sp. (in: bacteria)]
MDKLITIFIILFFCVSCSSTGRVVTDEGLSPVGISQPNKTAPDQPKKVSGDGKETAYTGKNRVTSTTDDEGNIAALLEHDDFKDFDIPIVFNDAVKYYVVYFAVEKKKIFANWLKRSRNYVPMIRKILKEHGLPEDLVYLAMIESGFNPKAYSTANACGPWQFIYATGSRYGLKVNFWIDERRDPEKSTVAAAKYLTDLFNQFGCWYLAAAGYNAGEGRVGRAIEKHSTNDFWELSKYNALPKETREYIPKLIAASIIAKDPEKFGFGSISYENPLAFVEVKVPRATSLAAIAKARSMSITGVKSLNPELLRGITPPDMDQYAVKLPSPVDAEEFSRGLETAMSKERKIQDVMVYKVKKKDTMAKILKRYRIIEEEINLVNNCDTQIKIKPGMTLNIPRFSGSAKIMTTSEKAAIVASAKASVMASTIPRPPLKASLMAPPKAPETVSRKETKDIRKEKDEAKIAKSEAAETEAERPHVLGKTKQPDKRQGPSKAFHIVKKGETLSDISTKYGVDVASLKSYNNLKNGKVYPDMKLRLASQSQKKNTGIAKSHGVKKNGIHKKASKK